VLELRELSKHYRVGEGEPIRAVDGVSLSIEIGERQRLMIALALSMKPRVVLADEPTGSLDTQRSNEVLALLREVCEEQQVAVLLVTHDPQAAAFADRVLELRDGRLGPYEPNRARPTSPATLSVGAN
jgi:putative ABC transport system ATP-binding protein